MSILETRAASMTAVEEISRRLTVVESSKTSASEGRQNLFGIIGAVAGIVAVLAVGFTVLTSKTTPVIIERSTGGDKLIQ